MGMLSSAAGDSGPIFRFYSFRLCRIAALLSLGILVGCAGRHLVVISTIPTDAEIAIDGVKYGRGRVEKRLNFAGGQVHSVLVSRLGFSQQSLTLTQPPESGTLDVKLEPQTKRVQ